MKTDEKKPISPDDVVKAVFAAAEKQPIIVAILGQTLIEDLCVKILKELYGVDFSKEEEGA